ncbi:MAG: phosphatase PAP2 family protein [Bacilli bacterium]|nr:phosphatase PAP2 family protein [Bacilli bacterium]
MTKKVLSKKGSIIISSFLAFVFIIYTILVKFVDVKPIGPNNSSVGFAGINGAFHKLIGSNMTLYKISELFGYILLLIVAYYGVIGIIQLLKEKSIKKVDREIIVLGIFYVLVLIVYVLFEKVVINYRPIIIEGELEASYPSSHTMLSLCVGLSSLIVSKKYINKKYLKLFNIVTIILMALVLLLRTISGVHWISDIIGGILISLILIMYFKTAYYWNRKVNLT